MRISHLIWSRPLNSVRVFKIRAHRSVSSIQNPQEKWLAQGNDQADALAEDFLQERAQALCATNANWSASSEKHRLQQAFLATQYLHDVSNALFKLLNEQEIPRSQARGPTPAQNVPPLDESQFQVFPFESPSPFLSPKWDPKWLALVFHYFGLIRWPQGQAQGPPISIMEVMVDFLITFQISTPVNKKKLKKKRAKLFSCMGTHQSFAVPGRGFTLAAASLNRVSLHVDAHAPILVTPGQPLPTCTGFTSLARKHRILKYVAVVAIAAPFVWGRRIPLPFVPHQAWCQET